MFQVSNLTATTKEYLEQAEQKAMEETQQLGLDSQKFQSFCEATGLDPKKANIKTIENYLNNNKAHYKAEFGGELAKKLKLEYSTENYSKLLNGELPDNLINGAKETYSNIRKNGKMLNTTDGEKLGLDIVLDIPKSVSIEFMRAKTKEERDFIVSCIAEARDEILNKKVAPLLSPSGGVEGKIVKTDLAYASFIHMETRPLKAENKENPNLHTHQTLADPHIHFHVSLAKATGYQIELPNGKIVNKILANDPSKVFEQQLEISASFDTLVQQKLAQRYSTEEAITKEGFKTYRISGYNESIEDRFSQRGLEVKKFKDKMKKEGVVITGDSQAERLMAEAYRKQSANQKNDLNATELLEALQDKVDKGLTEAEKFNLNLSVKVGGFDNKIQDKNINYEEVLKFSKLETQGLVKESDLRAEIIKQIRFKDGLSNGIEALEKEVDKTLLKLQGEEYGTKRLIKMENGNYTNLELAINERAMVEQLTELHKSCKDLTQKQYDENKEIYLNLINKYSEKGIIFNEGQLKACQQVIEEKNLQLCIGNAGVGKTATYISFVNDYYKEKGRKVIGVAVQGLTTTALSEANIEDRLNTSQFINKAFKNGKLNPKFLNEYKGGVICIDEASMLSPKDMAKLGEWANYKDNFLIDKDGNKQQAKIIMVGDGKQILNVGAGSNPFTITQDSIVKKEEISLISQNMRQKTDLMKQISNLYMEAKTQEAVKVLDENNLLFKGKAQTLEEDGKKVRVSAEKATMNSLIKDYLDNPLDKKDKMIIAGTNKEIKYINDELRTEDMKREAEKEAKDPNYKSQYDLKNQHYIEVCRINGNTKQFDNRAFCIGEKIILQKGCFEKQGRKEVKIADNSEMGVIKSITPLKNGSFDIELDMKTNQSRTIKFNTKDFNQFDHTYAISSNRSQGQSIESVQVLLGGSTFASNRNKNYVDGSRMKTQFKAYIVESELSDYIKNGEKAIVKESTINDKVCDKEVQNYLEQRAETYRKTPPALTKEQEEVITLKQESERQSTIERTFNLGMAKIIKEVDMEEAIKRVKEQEKLEEQKIKAKNIKEAVVPATASNDIYDNNFKTENQTLKEIFSKPIEVNFPQLKESGRFDILKIHKELRQSPETFLQFKDELTTTEKNKTKIESASKYFVQYNEDKIKALEYLKDNNLLTREIINNTFRTYKKDDDIKNQIKAMAEEFQDYTINSFTQEFYGKPEFKDICEELKEDRIQQSDNLQKAIENERLIKEEKDKFSNPKAVEAMFKKHEKNGSKMTVDKCSKQLKDDPEFMIKACKHNGLNLQYGSEKIKKDINVCREAIKQNGKAFNYASEAVKQILEREKEERERQEKESIAKQLKEELTPKLKLSPKGKVLKWDRLEGGFTDPTSFFSLKAYNFESVNKFFIA